MPVVYDGRYSVLIKIGNTTYNTWTDWHLIPASPPVVAPPEARISMVAIPGSSKVIDTSTLLSGQMTYGLQQGTWEFFIDHDQWSNSEACYQYLLSVLHGRYITATLTDNPTKTYTGRISIADRKSGANYSTISLNYYFPYDGNSGDDPDPEPSGGPDEIELFDSAVSISAEEVSNTIANIEYTTPYNIGSYMMEIDVISVENTLQETMTNAAALIKYNDENVRRYMNDNDNITVNSDFFDVVDDPYSDPKYYTVIWKIENIASTDIYVTYRAKLVKAT